MDLLEQLDTTVRGLSLLDLTSLLFVDVQDLAVAVEKVAGQLRGIACQALGVVAAADPDGVAWWWRDNVALTGEAAGHAVRRAQGLSALPSVGEAVVAGQITLEQAGALVPLVGKLPELELHQMQPMLIDGCRDRSVDSIGQWVRGLLALHAEKHLEDEQALADQQRMLKYRLGEDGTVRGRFVLPAEKAEAFLSVIEALARRQGLEDTRSAAQRRADSLLDIADLAARHADLPQSGGQRTQVSYVLPAEWATRIHGAATALGAGPPRRPEAISRLCSATPVSPTSCCRPAARSSPWRASPIRSPPPNAERSPPATTTAPPADARGLRRSATCTT